MLNIMYMSFSRLVLYYHFINVLWFMLWFVNNVDSNKNMEILPATEGEETCRQMTSTGTCEAAAVTVTVTVTARNRIPVLALHPYLSVHRPLLACFVLARAGATYIPCYILYTIDYPADPALYLLYLSQARHHINSKKEMLAYSLPR
jgi:hypothetical protein